MDEQMTFNELEEFLDTEKVNWDAGCLKIMHTFDEIVPGHNNMELLMRFDQFTGALNEFIEFIKSN